MAWEREEGGGRVLEPVPMESMLRVCDWKVGEGCFVVAEVEVEVAARWDRDIVKDLIRLTIPELSLRLESVLWRKKNNNSVIFSNLQLLIFTIFRIDFHESSLFSDITVTVSDFYCLPELNIKRKQVLLN